jgi:hypothetical protein
LVVWPSNSQHSPDALVRSLEHPLLMMPKNDLIESS